VPARTAPDVDHLGGMTDAKAVEVHGQHGSPFRRIARS
jgi:hypothetical protein